jgi:predicted nucleic acid-binding protein
MTAAMIDTNVLVYAVDERDPRKMATARVAVEALETQRRGVVTTQILGEFFNVVRCRFSRTLSLDVAFAGLERYAATMRVLDMRVPVVFEAARGVRRYGLSYYDAQIWASARVEGIELVLSEDFENGREIEGVRFVDPFAEGFSLADVLAQVTR